MPFLPLVLLFAWQALGRGASFALVWATAIFFGQVPGNKGRLLSIMSLIAVAWVILLVGFAVPLATGWLLERAGVLSNFDLPAMVVWGLTAAVVGIPAVVGAVAEWGEFNGSRAIGGWLRRIPASYPSTASLGVAVLEMIAIAPALLINRVRKKRRLLQVPLMLSGGESAEDLSRPVIDALNTLNVGEFRTTELEGPTSWPLRTATFAIEHLLGRAVRGDPVLVEGDDLRVVVYATNVGILGTAEEGFRARAAVERELAFSQAYLTWSAESQHLEERLRRLYRDRGGDVEQFGEALQKLQGEVDAAPLASDEWNLLYRLRLQLEREARTGDTAASNGDGKSATARHRRPAASPRSDHEKTGVRG